MSRGNTCPMLAIVAIYDSAYHGEIIFQESNLIDQTIVYLISKEVIASFKDDHWGLGERISTACHRMLWTLGVPGN